MFTSDRTCEGRVYGAGYMGTIYSGLMFHNQRTGYHKDPKHSDI